MPYQPRATLQNPYGPQVTFKTEDVLPPSAVYMSPEDHMVVWVMTDATVITIYLQLRILMPTGEVKIVPSSFSNPFTYDWYPAFFLPPVEGYLLGAQCWAQNPQRGQCFVSVQLMRSAPPDLNSSGEVVLQGYINSLNVLTYPGSEIQPTFNGRGAFLTITQPTQTGNNLLFGVPPFALWRVCSLTLFFTTSAVAGTRQVNIRAVDHNNKIYGQWLSSVTQAAGQGWGYGFSCGGANVNLQNSVSIAGPTDLYLAQQSSLQTSIPFLDAGDTLQANVLMVEEWMGQ